MISKKTILRGVIILLCLVFCGVLYALFQYNKPHTNVATSDVNITLTAQALYADFENNEAAANTKYLDQIIQVTGPILSVKTVKDQKIISIGSEETFGSVKCYLTPEEIEKNYTLKEGQIITVKGICTGYLMDVILVKAVLTN